MKKCRFILMFVLAVFCAQAVSAITIMVKKGTTTWDNVYVYAWGGSDETGNWPGKRLISSVQGWYSYTFSGTVGNVIFNNGGSGTGNQWDAPAISADACFTINSDGVVSADCPTETQDIFIRFKQVTGGWTDLAIYTWWDPGTGGTDASFGGWPGERGTVDGDGWHTVIIPLGQFLGTGVIFNNNDNGLQFNADNLTSSGCYELNTDAGTATKVACDYPVDIGKLQTKGISIYPNPAESTITVDADNVKSVSIINVNGQKTKAVAKNNIIDVQQLPAGMYFLEIQLEDGSVHSMKFIKK